METVVEKRERAEKESGSEEKNEEKNKPKRRSHGRNRKKNNITARGILDISHTSGKDRSNLGVQKLKQKKYVREMEEGNKRFVMRMLRKILLKIFDTLFDKLLPHKIRRILFDVVREIEFPLEEEEAVLKSVAA